MKRTICALLTACLAAAFLLTAAACAQPSPQELWQTAMQKLEQEDHITAEYVMTLTQENDLGRKETQEDALSMQLWRSEQGGYDSYTDLGDGVQEWSIGGVTYLPQSVGGRVVYVPQFSASLGMQIAEQPVSVPDLIGTKDAILPELGIEEVIKEKVASAGEGHRYTLKVNLSDLLQAVLERLDELASVRVHQYKTFIYQLFDPSITVAEFYEMLEEKLSEFGLSLRLLCTDSFWLGLMQERGLLAENVFGRSAAEICYLLFSKIIGYYDGDALKIAPPAEGESCTDYLLRALGGERATLLFGILGSRNGEMLFEDIKNRFDEFNLHYASVTDVIDSVWKEIFGMPLGIRETLEEIDLRSGTVQMEAVFGAEGRLEEFSLTLDMVLMQVDKNNRHGIVQTHAEMTVGLSYQPFTPHTLSQEQLYPLVGVPQMGEDGRAFLPVDWNCGSPEEFSASIDSFYELTAYDADGIVLYYDSVYLPAVACTAEEDGFSADLSACMAELFAAADIDADIAAAADSYRAAFNFEYYWETNGRIGERPVVLTLAKDGTILSML